MLLFVMLQLPWVCLPICTVHSLYSVGVRVFAVPWCLLNYHEVDPGSKRAEPAAVATFISVQWQAEGF